LSNKNPAKNAFLGLNSSALLVNSFANDFKFVLFRHWGDAAGVAAFLQAVNVPN